jgi:hypothetical protein
MEQCPSWEANNHSSTQETPTFMEHNGMCTTMFTEYFTTPYPKPQIHTVLPSLFIIILLSMPRLPYHIK